MAHEIESVLVNGIPVYEAVYANNPAWHGLGVTFDAGGSRGLISREAIELGHLGWTVAKEKLKLEDETEAEGFYGLVRQDTRKTLAVVKGRYESLQNEEAFEFLDSLLMDGVMQYESAFALRGGEEVCLLARMPSYDWVVEDHDMNLRYILLSMSHGYGGINILPTAVRVVCANTQRLALGTGKKDTYTIRHTGDIAEKLNYARQYIGQLDKKFTDYNEKARSLLVGCTQEQRKEYLAELFPAPAEDAGQRTKNNHENAIQAVKNAWSRPAQQVQGVKGTWWALFNAVTEVEDHGTPTRKSKDVRMALENRWSNVSNGPGAAFKDKALELALTMAG